MPMLRPFSACSGPKAKQQQKPNARLRPALGISERLAVLDWRMMLRHLGNATCPVLSPVDVELTGVAGKGHGCAEVPW